MARAPWRDALDGKIAVLRAIHSADSLMALVAYFMESPTLRAQYPGRRELLDHRNRLARKYQEVLYDQVHQAEPFALTNDLYDYLQRQYILARDPTLAVVHRPFALTDLPTPNGLLWLPHPIDVWSEDEPSSLAGTARAIYWGGVETLRLDGQELGPPQRQPALAVVTFTEGHSLGWTRNEQPMLGLVPMIQPKLFVGQTLHDYVLGVRDTYASDVRDQAIHIWPVAQLAILFDLMRQRVLVWGGSGVERDARRQAERHNLSPIVQVVDWRKANYRYPKGYEPKAVDWSCRWPSRAHTRRLADGRVIDVAASIKGPKDRPFKGPNDRAHQIKR